MEIDYAAIGKKIREERKSKKLSQQALAKLVNVGTTHISHIESGSTIPSLKTFIAIIVSLDASADVVLSRNLNNSKHVLNEELASILADCDADEAAIITSVINALAVTLKSLNIK
jgi:transcriptional regulator with XRE-family HTH domain